MSNIICYTQDVLGERPWLESHFPGYVNLETESSGKWLNADSSGNLIFEIPYTSGYTNEPKVGTKVKTIYTNKYTIKEIFNDNGWTKSSQLLLNDNIRFGSQSIDTIKSYQMFNFARCGTVFAESILIKKYQKIQKHYCLDNSPETVVAKCQDPSTLICLIYRQDWWKWVVSTSIANNNDFYHYDSKVDWDSLRKVSIDRAVLSHLQNQVSAIFNFWCNLRLLYPMHHVKLFKFEDVILKNQHKTEHKKIPYSSESYIVDYENTKLLFDQEYLPVWQQMENNALSHLKKMQVHFESVI